MGVKRVRRRQYRNYRGPGITHARNSWAWWFFSRVAEAKGSLH